MTIVAAALDDQSMIASRSSSSSSSGMGRRSASSSSVGRLSSTTSPKTLRALSSLQRASSSFDFKKNNASTTRSRSRRGIRPDFDPLVVNPMGKRRATFVKGSSFVHQSRAQNPLAGLSSHGSRGFVRYNFQEEDVLSTTLNKKRRFQNVLPEKQQLPVREFSATEIEDCLSDEECKDQLIEGLEKSLSSSSRDEKEEEDKKKRGNERQRRTAIDVCGGRDGETKKARIRQRERVRRGRMFRGRG